ncbi:dihydrodipicolinate synthase family protein [Streptomyces sp. 8N616]|uniref:dihydrodipicolinate synthase family protein n=1 Tax=Streptomyces sp. 8N616 TaxID=3457414 RepID=UPI003FD59752
MVSAPWDMRGWGRSDPSAIRGSIAPVVTPFTADGAIDHESLRSLIRFQLESGSHGISLGGSTGEPSAQSAAERIAAMRTAVEEVGDRVPFPARRRARRSCLRSRGSGPVTRVLRAC